MSNRPFSALLSRLASAAAAAATNLFAGRSFKPSADLIEATTGSSHTVSDSSRIQKAIRLFAFALLFGGASTVMAGSWTCGPTTPPYNANFQTLDGFQPSTWPVGFDPLNISTLSFVGDCTIKNFPQSVGGFAQTTSTLNFNLPGKGAVIVMDNVYYTGKMACSNLPPGVVIWWVNGAWNSIDPKCQAFMPPLDGLQKLNPAGQVTQTIGVPFTYTLTMPTMVHLNSDGTYTWTGLPDTATVTNVDITDDLSAISTNANLVYVSNTAYLKSNPSATFSLTNIGTPQYVHFQYANPIAPGDQLIIQLTVKLADDIAVNTPGKQFTNTANWTLSKLVTNSDGSTTQINNVPGMDGVTAPMTVVAPNIVVSKTSTVSALNLTGTAPFTIKATNTGPSLTDAYGVVITDNIPAGMCKYDPSASVTAQIYNGSAPGSTPVGPPLVLGTDYSFTWNGGTASACQLTLAMNETPAAKIPPNYSLWVTYNGRLDTGTAAGLTFTNVAGATTYFNAPSTYTGRHQFPTPNTLTNGTPGVSDFQDAWTITSASQGYYFLKSVEDLTTGASPSKTALPGDRLRYTLQIQNFTFPLLNNIQATDLLPAGMFDLSTLAVYAPGTTVPTANYSINTTTGTVSINGLNLGSNVSYQLQFDVTLLPSLVNGTVVSNQATNFSGTDTLGVVWTGKSDDPNDANGPSLVNDPNNDPTNVAIIAPGALSKASSQSTATIGQTFKYIVTVPSSNVSVPLYDVHVTDNLGTIGATLKYVSASAHLASGAQSWASLSNNGTSTNLDLYDPVSGIDIPANDQAIIEITVQLDNVASNTTSLAPFNNTANYTYNKLNNANATVVTGTAGATLSPVTVVEPKLAATKTVANLTNPGNSAAVGDTLKYTITLNNTGTSTAYEADVMDTLPSNVALVPGSAQATINGVSDTALVVNPATLSSGALDWGFQNGDNSFNIPQGGTLVLTYQVTVQQVNGTPITNSVYADWTSLDGANPDERTGAGCPTTTSPNTYCTGPVSATINSLDPTTITKAVVSDTWNPASSTANDGILRVGDTVIYSLTLNLREGITQNVVITDQLPANLAFDSVVSINGVTASPYTPVAPFTYNNFTGPTVSGNTVTWNFGNITNAVDNNPANNTFVIQYRARVVNTITQAPTTSLTNTATLNYAIGGVAATPKTGSATISAIQPVMSTPTKTATGFTSPANVNVATDHIPFILQSCNSGPAPAYSVKLTDVLAPQIDGATLTVPVVTAGPLASPVTLTAGTDYTYSYTASTQTMAFVLNTPVNPNECVTVNYTVGFHNNVAPNSTWTNSVTLDEYWSLQTPTTAGKMYGPLTSAPFIMTNPVTITPLTKVVASPAAPANTVTIGQDVTYTITVPGSAVNAQLSNVVVTDTLDPVLQYVGPSSAVDDLGAPVTLTDTTSGNNVNLAIASIPAGRKVIITLHARVANNGTAKAGYSFANTASYSYTGMTAGSTSGTSGQLTIVEPSVTINKIVFPNTPPTAGEVLTYTVNLAAPSGGSYSTAYDLVLTDTLSAGLAYIPGTSKLNGGAIADPAIAGQTLTWNTPAVPDMAPGSTNTITYQVKVQNSITAGQLLSNSATIRWTSLTGASPNERNGSGTPAYNNYFATSTAPLPPVGSNYSFNKALNSTTYTTAPLPQDARVGDFVEYKLTLGLQEGTTNGVVVTDVLPAGMVFDSTVSIIPGSSNLTYTGTTQPTSGATGTLTWNLGTVTNVADGNNTNDYLVIVYRARVLNNTLPQAATTTLTNNASLNYSGAATPLTSNLPIYVLQPNLSVTKGLMSTTSGSNIINAGDVIVYSADIKNNGAAPAYDPLLVDTLPAGLRQGGVTTTKITLLDATNTVTATLANLNPSYVASTGVATWNFDTGVADAYTIPAGYTLHVEFRVTADANLGSGLTLTNTVNVPHYYSFDNNALPPPNGVVGSRQDYTTNPASSYTLTSSAPGALGKANPAQLTAAIGQQFTYTITVPAVAAKTAIYDAQIIDTLPAGVVFVSAAKTSAGGTWTPVTSVSGSTLTITGSGTGIDIPAGQQAVIAVTVVLKNDTTINYTGRQFANTATYNYNQVDSVGPVITTPSVTTPVMTVVGPDTLTLTKTGPATMRIGLPGTFTLVVTNPASATASRAWDVTINDLLPNPTPGGMCSVAPVITSIVNSGQPAGTTYTAGTDYSTSFVTGSPTCSFSLTGKTDKFAIDPGQTLTITYTVGLDADNPPNISLTNIAGATQWFSQDTSGAGATGETHTYTGPLTTGTVGTLDNQDAHTVTTEAPVLVVQKTVSNLTNPALGANAKPGDKVHYTITVSNSSAVDVPSFSLLDDLGALNPSAVFVSGSLSNITVPAGADTTNTKISGGTNGAGLLDVRNLAVGPSGSPTATVTVSFDATLVPVIKSGTVVLNQGHLYAYGNLIANTDDPNVNGTDNPNVLGDEDPTRTAITSAPVMQVYKTSQDMTGDPAVLVAGDTLHYTITVKNIGTENATGVALSDLIPSFTTYVAGTTHLNGVVVTDPALGISALQNGMLINAPENTTKGVMRADATSTTSNVATITFDVKINANALSGTIISNQGYVNGSGIGSGAFATTPSDDPRTVVLNDPTQNIVGNLPLLNTIKTVTLATDVNGNGAVDPGDVLRYTITVNNTGKVQATGVTLTDGPNATNLVNTNYVSGSTLLNGSAVADPSSGVSALSGGMPVNAAGSASGTIPAGANAVVTFNVTVASTASPGFVISNQGTVTSTQLPSQLTDADGNPGNGYQPTTIVVGSAQQLTITKQNLVVGGGTLLAGGKLQYIVTVTNTGKVPATNVVITDDLTPLNGLATYISGSATLNGSTVGVSLAGSVITADYSTNYGSLAPGASATLRFQVQTVTPLADGTNINNTAQVNWNTPALTASASATATIGSNPGYADLNGRVWYDANFDNAYDTYNGSNEMTLAGWTVVLYRGGTALGNTTTDANGLYKFSGLAPTLTTTTADQYEIRFSAPGAGANTAKLGLASSAFTNSLQRISNIVASSGVQNLNLPIDPNGIVYDSMRRTAVAGATLTMTRAGSTTALPGSCFDDPAQQNQVTLAAGFYKFDLNFSNPACPSGVDYVIRVTPPGGYTAGLSTVIPPTTSDKTSAYSVTTCSADAVSTPSGYCEAQASQYVPTGSGTSYYLNLTLNSPIPGGSQIFNNHIPIDPPLGNALTITKTAALVNVSRGQLVPYTITVNNTFGAILKSNIVDTFPAGFKYVAGSSRVDGKPMEPVKTNRTVSWNNLTIDNNSQHTIKMLFIVGSGVSEGEYVNRAQVIDVVTGKPASGEASATVRVIPDPTFDCTDVIGKVFDDANRNGYQDPGEKGLPGVRLATVRGLLVTTDKYGRYHITCAIVPDENRGSNFIMKVDDRTLPTGYRITTENPLVLRATRGKMMKFDFGATIHKIVRLDTSNGVFEPGSTEMRIQWKPRLELLMKELKKGPSILRVGYMAETEDEDLVDARVKAVKEAIAQLWSQENGNYKLEIETEVFWRTGAPPDRSSLK